MWLRLFQTSWINPWLTYIPKEIHFLQWCILIESKREEQRIESCTLPRNALSCKGATSGTKEGGASDRCRGRAHVGKLCSEASDVLDANWFSLELQKRPLRKGPPASHVQMNHGRLFLACSRWRYPSPLFHRQGSRASRTSWVQKSTRQGAWATCALCVAWLFWGRRKRLLF